MRIVAAILDLQQREIGLLVGADHGGVDGAAVVECYFHLGGVLDHVVVGDDEAVRRDDEARTLRLRGAWTTRTPAALHAGDLSAELLEEAVEGIVGGELLSAASILIVIGGRRGLADLNLHGNNGAADALNRVGEGDGRVRADGLRLRERERRRQRRLRSQPAHGEYGGCSEQRGAETWIGFEQGLGRGHDVLLDSFLIGRPRFGFGLCQGWI